jgi:LysM repeat protein
LKKAILGLVTFILWGLMASVGMADESVHVVKAGDTLGQIASHYGTTVESLKEINGLVSDLIFPGQELIIHSDMTFSEDKQTNVVYIVEPGDYLIKIAQQYNISYYSLISYNNLTSDIIMPGDSLLIPAANQTPSRSRSRVDGAQVTQEAAKYLNTPYAYGGARPGGFDCSGFVQYVYSQFGFQLPRTADGQYNIGEYIDKAALVPGDLVFFKCNSSIVDHVGIYVGDNRFIHSSSPRSGGVIYTSLDDSYYIARYAGARRILY